MKGPVSLFSKPEISRRFLRVWQRNLSVWLSFFEASLLANLGEPLLFLFAFGYGLGAYIKDINGIPYIEFIAPGLLVSSAMNSAAYECTFGAYTRMTMQRTYDAIASTPVNYDEIIIGEVAWGTTKALISGAVILAIFYALGVASSPWGALAVIPVILTGLLFSELSILFTGLSPSYDFFSYYFTILIGPQFFFSGIFFPVETMPDWVKIIAWFLPLTHCVNLVRPLLLGTQNLSMLLDLLWIAVCIGLLLPFTLYAVKRRMIK
jgi:lipooligosaccharide transport system permease protein